MFSGQMLKLTLYLTPAALTTNINIQKEKKMKRTENTSNILKLTWKYSDFCSFTPHIEVSTVLQLHSVPQQKLTPQKNVLLFL